jgi:uncharacterized protein (TIGR02594 family)
MVSNPRPELPWLETAFSLIGTKETPGFRNTTEIMDWSKVTEVTKNYSGDNVAWCGLFVAFCMADNGLPIIDTPLWAKSWNSYGTSLSKPQVGAIMVFTRNSGGHVAFYLGETSDSYIILGGNQSDAVNIEHHSKSTCIGHRWPPGMEKFLK